MRLICVNNYDDILFLTIGKEYKCIRNDDRIYVVINDTGNECIYLKKYFLTIDEIRNKKLEELGI